MPDNGSENIGGINVSISGDYSQLQADFDTIQGLAEASGAGVADAFTSAAAASNAFDDAVAGASAGSEQLRDSLGSVVSSAKETRESLDENTESANELLHTLMEFAGISVSVELLREMVSESIELASALEKTTIAIGALRGDSSDTNEEIEQLEQTANKFGVSFESLLGVDQKFAALGLSVEESKDAMTAAISAAAALGTSVDETANTIDRLALSGMASTRQLVALGLTTKDLAAVMGVAQDQVAETFKGLDQSDRLAVLEVALQKYGNVAAKVADSFAGKWQTAKNQFNAVLAEIGGVLEKSVIGWDEAFQFLSDHMQGNIEKAESAIGGLEDKAHDLGLQFAPLTTAYRDGEESAIQYVAALNKLIDAHTGAAAAAAKTLEVQKAVAAEFAEAPLMDKPVRDFTAALSAADQGMDLFSAQASALAAKQEQLTLQLGVAQADLERAAVTYNAASQSGVQYAEALNGLIAAEKEYDAAAKAAGTSQDQLNKALASVPNIALPIAQIGKEIQAAVEQLDKFVPALQAPAKPAQTLDEAFKALHLTVDDTTGALDTKMLQAFETVANSGKATTQQLDAAWGAVSGQISKVAKTDLPEAVQFQQLYVDSLEATNPPLVKLEAAQAALLKDEIALAEERGQSADQYLVDLANLTERTEILNSTTNILGRAYQTLMTDVSKSFSSLAGDISSGIVEGQKFQQIWQTIWQSFAKDILSTAITAIEEWGLKTLAQLGLVHVATAALSTTQTAAHALFVSQKTTETTATTALATAQKTASAATLGQIAAEETAVAGLGAAWTTFDADRIAGLTSIRAAESVADIGAVNGEAAIAGAAGFASVMEDVPFPANVALAPAVAATSAATVLSLFTPLASFATGIDYVPYDMVAQIHQGERIVPAAQNSPGANAPVNVQIIVQADRNPAQTARILAAHLKRLSPSFSPLGAG